MIIRVLNGNNLYYPIVEEGVTWNTERKDAPGTVKFSLLWDESLKIEEGNLVQIIDGDTGVFQGYVFKKESSKSGSISVTAYDQLRYFKNKDNYIYSNKSTSDLVRMIANDFKLNTGTIVETGYKMSRCESGSSLFDIFNASNDETLKAKKELYVLYDDFGKLCLRNISDLTLNILIDEDTTEDYTLTSSIDENTYNKIKLTYDNDKTGKREQYILMDADTIATWGVLQYLEEISDSKDVNDRLQGLIDLYNHKTTSFKVKNCFGDIRVRAGTSVLVRFVLEGKEYYSFMLVESAKHTWKNDEHKMDLTLSGGAING